MTQNKRKHEIRNPKQIQNSKTQNFKQTQPREKRETRNTEENLTKQDLNLLLMYINGWEEESRQEPGEKLFRLFRGYPYDVLHELEKLGLILQFPHSIIITKEGISKAKALKHQYLKSL